MNHYMSRYILRAVCMLVLLFSAPAQAAEKLLDIQEITSPGGITAWLVEDHSLPIIAMQFAFVGAGSAHDAPDKQGLAILVSNTMDEGAGEYDSAAFQKALTNHSITVRFSAGRDHFGGNVKTLTKHKDLAFSLAKLAINEPRFDEDPVERMRAANLSRIRSSLSDPSWKAARIQNDVAYQGHPYAQNSGGTLTSLRTITPDDLRGFVDNRLARDNLRVSVMGDITADALGLLLDDIFGALPAQANLPSLTDISIQNGGKIYLYRKDIPQTIINIMQPGIGRDHPDYYIGMVMNYILGGGGFGSRLTEEIREKRGLTYGIFSRFHDLNHAQALTIGTSTKNESVAEMLSLIKAELQKMIDTPVSDQELTNAKSYLIGSFPLSLSATDNIAAILNGLRVDDLPVDYLDGRADKINAVSAGDIQRLARELLQPDGLTIVMVGQPEGVTATEIIEILPNVE